MINLIEKIFGKDNYITIPTNKINTSLGHGNTLSVKIVVPTACQANCDFCFNKYTKETQKKNFDKFLYNLKGSLEIIKNSLNDRKITIDITGGEPTFTNRLYELLEILKLFKSEKIVDKIVLTTNGFKLLHYNTLDPIDIVNVSIHDYRYNNRQSIFKTKDIPNDEDLKKICKRFNTTAVAVCEKIDDFENFIINFANFSKVIGFKNARIRTNYLTDGDIFYKSFVDYKIIHCSGLDKKILTIDGFNVNLYRGVKDLTECVIGSEIVIDDDGLIYLDYNKRYKINNLEDFDKNIYVNLKTI